MLLQCLEQAKVAVASLFDCLNATTPLGWCSAALTACSLGCTSTHPSCIFMNPLTHVACAGTVTVRCVVHRCKATHRPYLYVTSLYGHHDDKLAHSTVQYIGLGQIRPGHTQEALSQNGSGGGGAFGGQSGRSNRCSAAKTLTCDGLKSC